MVLRQVGARDRELEYGPVRLALEAEGGIHSGRIEVDGCLPSRGLNIGGRGRAMDRERKAKVGLVGAELRERLAVHRPLDRKQPPNGVAAPAGQDELELLWKLAGSHVVEGDRSCGWHGAGQKRAEHRRVTWPIRMSAPRTSGSGGRSSHKPKLVTPLLPEQQV